MTDTEKATAQEAPKWIISTGDKIEIGKWYATKRGFIVQIDDLYEDGQAKVISHRTGNPIVVSVHEISEFTPAENPGTPCGTVIDKDGNEKSRLDSSYGGLYAKYPHIVEGSIYRVQNTNSGVKQKIDLKRRARKTTVKGQVRCKIWCQEPECKNQRDIKVQDAFQVKKCDSCKKKTKKINKND